METERTGMSHNLEPWDYDVTRESASYYEVEREDAIDAQDEHRAEFCRIMRLEALKRLGMITIEQYNKELWTK